jgi:ketosteroid isomerase-like protein
VSEENVEIVRRVLSEWERGNFWTVDAFAPDIRVRWVDPIVAPARGETHGLRELGRGMADLLRQWEKGSATATPERIVDAGEHVVSVETWRARGRASGAETEMLQACVWTLAAGKVTRMVRYSDEAQALQAAGLSE